MSVTVAQFLGKSPFRLRSPLLSSGQRELVHPKLENVPCPRFLTFLNVLVFQPDFFSRGAAGPRRARRSEDWIVSANSASPRETLYSPYSWGPISEQSCGTGRGVLAVESACHGLWRISVMFVEVALSEKSPYLGGAWVRLGLWQEPWMKRDPCPPRRRWLHRRACRASGDR